MRAVSLKVSERPRVGKLDAVTSQLEAAVYLILKGFDPIPIHTLIWASRTILRDLHKVNPNKTLAFIGDAVTRKIKPEFLKEWRGYENRASNFFKHANKDPNDILEGIDIAGINAIEMFWCIFASGEYLGVLPRCHIPCDCRPAS